MDRKLRGLTLVAAGLTLAAAGFVGWLALPPSVPDAPALDSLQASAEEGRYLATAANCVSCHTRKDGAPYAGGVAFRTDFGTIYSTNITKDAEAGIGGWSFAQFYAAMRYGLRADGAHLYPAFPYPSFTQLRDEDIASLYLYLRSIEPSSQRPPENELKFPFGVRTLMKAWNALFLDTTRTAAADQTPLQRGQYLVEALGHCGACHTPRNALGAERKDLALTGGTIYDEVAPGKYRRWSSVNLTPAGSGLGPWSKAEIIDYLKQGQNGRAVVHGPMNEVVMNSTRHLLDTDLDAIASYLQSLPPKAQAMDRAADAATLKKGEIAYTVHCGTCHLPEGTGDVGLGVSLAGNAVVQAKDPATLINVILYGPHLAPPPFVSDRTKMKPFGKRLPAEEIAAIASYLRSEFGNQAGGVTVEQVEAQR